MKFGKIISYQKKSILTNLLYVLEMKLDCIQVVYDLITERFLRTPGLVTKYFERIFMSFQKKLFICMNLELKVIQL